MKKTSHPILRRRRSAVATPNCVHAERPWQPQQVFEDSTWWRCPQTFSCPRRCSLPVCRRYKTLKRWCKLCRLCWTRSLTSLIGNCSAGALLRRPWSSKYASRRPKSLAFLCSLMPGGRRRQSPLWCCQRRHHLLFKAHYNQKKHVLNVKLVLKY